MLWGSGYPYGNFYSPLLAPSSVDIAFSGSESWGGWGRLGLKAWEKRRRGPDGVILLHQEIVNVTLHTTSVSCPSLEIAGKVGGLRRLKTRSIEPYYRCQARAAALVVNSTHQ